jgi:hypothetical protein
LGKQSQSGNIRFTVGQYSLIIKINGTNSVNCGKFCQFCAKYAILQEFFVITPSSPPPPADNNLGKFLRKIFLTTRAQSEKVGQISFRPLIFSFPYAHAANTENVSMNTQQMKILEISIFLAFFTENLVKLHLKFVAQSPID